ncbi:MAG: A/G-specific adenine glycosylase [Actinomycetota bacterium]
MGRLGRDDRLVSALLDWGASSLRDLPWRRTADPWLILVSEVMLQQTSVARVLPKFEAFAARYPTPSHLAAASLGDVLVVWQGLGYPRRCRNLHLAAAAIVDAHNGRVPDSLDELLSLPGVGAYTARAVLAFAHRRDVAVVDTNVSRVLSRIDGTSMSARELQNRADALVPRGLAWEWNQVMMDLGARICTARAPDCSGCPAHGSCMWRGEGPDPAPGSAGASRPQGTFEGSDRQARGRALRALAEGTHSRKELAAAMGVEPGRAARLIDALVSEGLAIETGRVVSMPR